ncbi:MAG: SAM-dependent methyltransferase, partial [Aequorivita sp.]|nr:SAM-dependent methyltransferase [Aequorivita sp.]
MNFYETFWNHKYLSGETGWDIGYVSTPIKEYIDQLSDKNLKILIPGGGNSYEAEYLFESGFNNV